MNQSDYHLWDDIAQKVFFDELRAMNHDERGAFVLQKVEILISHGGEENPFLLKAAESLMNMYTLKFNDPGRANEANSLLAAIYSQLGEEEKASRFLR